MQETLPWRKDRPRSNYPTDAGTVETEDASEAGAEAVFTDELLKSVEAADINSLQPGMAGFSICSADIFGLLCFVYFSGEFKSFFCGNHGDKFVDDCRRGNSALHDLYKLRGADQC